MLRVPLPVAALAWVSGAWARVKRRKAWVASPLPRVSPAAPKLATLSPWVASATLALMLTVLRT